MFDPRYPFAAINPPALGERRNSRPSWWLLAAVALGSGLATFIFWCWAAMLWMHYQ